MTIEILCDICGLPVAAGSPNYRKITGWEQVRKGGGANAITMRREVGVWAHYTCIDIAKSGLVGQERMFG